MSVIAGSGLGKHYGTRALFEGAEINLAEGTRVGLCGANGSGKTTLFRILEGMEQDFDGRLTRKRDLRMAFLEQDPKFPEGATVFEAMLSADPELLELEHGMKQIHEQLEHHQGDADALLKKLGDMETRFEAKRGWDVESRAERLLEGVGFPSELKEAQVSTLSGGERGRLAFARVLLLEPDLWLLDEPTNHLDIDGILFLESFLRESKAGTVVVSHDRRFLDRVTDQTWEIEGERLWTYPGAYSRSRVLRDERIKSSKRSFAQQQAFIEKESEFIRRYQAGQRARQATGRLKRLERLARVERPDERARVMDLDLSSGESPGTKILALRGVAARFGERTLFDNLDLDLMRGEVIGVAGPNGAGKTTLMRILLGQMPPSEGTVKWGERTRVGTLSQHEKFPDEGSTPYGFLRTTAPRLTEQQIRNLLGAMLFPGEAVDRPVSGLSGGERKRLMLTRMLVEGFNVLLLDEPTNHLDIPSREALELALASYDGTLIIVSHDRHFVDQMADRILWIEDGEANLSEGGFAEALEKRARRKAAKAAAPKAEAKVAGKAPAAPAAPVPARPKSAFAKLSNGEIESRIAAAELRIKELEASFTRSEVFLDKAKLKSAQDEHAVLRAELAALEDEWLTRSR